MVGTLTIHLHLPGCHSLKEKRSQIKPLLARLHREFNVSTAELDLQDAHQQAVIGCAMLGTDAAHLQSALETVRRWVEAHWREGDILAHRIELVY
ncbi:MAG: DUF503 domain-containing protein [Anaerolineales bacterium]|nr:DUF503 domain-containing protein [Anaerolineales bacterium]MCX7753831.1 DUF503 domain-containing protein [Anaerolineales bacterium]MDW8276427.1 DUF503 domain-containing protein [Anaerolineales bacterium]